MEVSDLEMLGRLGLATGLGGLIGLERELHDQPAGLRTHMVVAVGACLIMLVSMHMATLGGGADPSRIAAQVVSGIGFLGAGAIIRFGISVRGLTTAACLWTAAAIGLAAGSGYYKGAYAATGFTLIAVLVFDKFEKAFMREKTLRRFTVHAGDAPGLVGRLEGIMDQYHVRIKEMEVQRDAVEGKVQVHLTASCPNAMNVDNIIRDITGLAGVNKAEID